MADWLVKVTIAKRAITVQGTRIVSLVSRGNGGQDTCFRTSGMLVKAWHTYFHSLSNTSRALLAPERSIADSFLSAELCGVMGNFGSEDLHRTSCVKHLPSSTSHVMMQVVTGASSLSCWIAKDTLAQRWYMLKPQALACYWLIPLLPILLCMNTENSLELMGATSTGSELSPSFWITQ